MKIEEIKPVSPIFESRNRKSSSNQTKEKKSPKKYSNKKDQSFQDILKKELDIYV